MANAQQLQVGDEISRSVNLSWTMKLNAGDFVQFYFTQNVVAGNVTVQGAASCTGFRIY